MQKFGPTGNFIRKFGSLGSGDGQFKLQVGIALDSSNIYIADRANDRIQVLGALISSAPDFDTDGVPDFQDSDQGTDVGSCSIAPAGSAKSFPVYLLIPALVVMRRLWRRSNRGTGGRV